MKELLKASFLFEKCDFEQIWVSEDLASKVKTLKFGPKETILSELTAYRGIFFILTGNAIVTSGESKGTLLRPLGHGDTFGAASVFSDDDLYRTSVITTNGCTVALIERNVCEKLVTCYPVCAVNLIRFLTGRIAFLNRKITAFTAGSADEKTAIWIMSLPIGEDNIRIVPSYTQAAANLCLGRASLYRALESLENRGYIEREGKTIKVLNEKALTSMY